MSGKCHDNEPPNKVRESPDPKSETAAGQPVKKAAERQTSPSKTRTFINSTLANPRKFILPESCYTKMNVNEEADSISNTSHYENETAGANGGSGGGGTGGGGNFNCLNFHHRNSILDENAAAAVEATALMNESVVETQRKPVAEFSLSKRWKKSYSTKSAPIKQEVCVATETTEFFLNAFQQLTGKIKTKNERRVILNVGGTKHEVLWKTLEKLPSSRLGKLRFAATLSDLEKLCDDYDVKSNEIYFDRHSSSFATILNYYRSGKLHLIEELCILSFSEDLIYWGIDDCFLESCCHLKYHQKRDTVLEEMRKEEEAEMETIVSDEKFGDFMPKFRKKIWNLMENPQTSRYARAIAFISIFFVILSSVTLTLNTIPELQKKELRYDPKLNAASNRSNSYSDSGSAEVTSDLTTVTTMTTHHHHGHGHLHVGPNNQTYVMTDNPIFEHIEVVCIGWFTLEYLLRLFSSPNKWRFLKGALNIIDLISIVPYFVSLFFSSQQHENLNNARRILTLFRVLRILRIFKLARHSTGLKSLGYTLQRSNKELGLLMMFLTIAVLLFSSLCYFAEKEEHDTKFTSIPATFWWAVISMTT